MASPETDAIDARILKRADALAIAWEIVGKVGTILTIGASNRPGSKQDAQACIDKVRDFMKANVRFKGQAHKTLLDMRAEATRARLMGCGNCGEQTSIAFIECVDRKIEPLDYLECDGKDEKGNDIEDHAFLVIGRREESNVSRFDPEAWGKDAVVCDAWMRRAYPCEEMADNLKSIAPSGRFRSRYRYRTLRGFTNL